MSREHRNLVKIRLRLGVATVAATGLLTSCSSRHPVESPPDPVQYRHIVRTSPRPLQIHVLRVDLTHPGVEVVSIIADDPDGGGRAHSVMTDPLELASRPGIVAAINANAFGVLDGSEDEYETTYVAGRPTRIVGWAETGGQRFSRPQKGYFSFWVDDTGVKIYNLGKPKPAKHALAGFGRLMQDGEITEQRSGPLHPRSAVGYDAARSALVLVVVDGRQNGYSEGMTQIELANLMQELGCATALNLDGGGSSILLLADDSGALEVKNQPSDGSRRPIPVMLGIRLKK
ncbi:MAG: phosphodiester glycosidase family protein [Verrucomicrobia bacterium]|nr:phosphodiester glycosidase family protein [Verrucomicrobiota bacterium]MDA1085994.1 phosphodiester glycosidase family protein [Verrucomicrobiota bacterium]